MEIAIYFIYFVIFIIAFFLSLISMRYFITMWKYKNRKKDGSEDEDFKKFD
jgi:heme/copper-type cytochrome/quinol oxidase subunit 2